LRYRPTARSPKQAGAPTAITGEAARNRVHAVRAEADAVLVGVSTVMADDPLLTCRLPGLEDRSPVRVVSDSRASLPPTAVWPAAPAIGAGVAADACRRGRATGARAGRAGCRAHRLCATGDGKVDLADALRRLAERGINRVLAEGGARMARALIEADLVDEVYLISASKELGTGGLDALPACRSAPSPTANVSARPARNGLGKTF
jgi:diaminohydroxyphosphoribosylaminopyrimidine deaminase / 5-amino-6-(5-phosphoribosylamino)uracil reductase